MTHSLSLRLGDANDLAWAQHTVTEHHYLRRRVDPRARPMAYIIDGVVAPHTNTTVGLIMLGIPHATKCTGWWGYPDLPTQWQVVDLCRIWLAPAVQSGGAWCKAGIVPGFVDRRGAFRSTAATWAIHEVLRRVQADRVRLWPPVYPAQPYHIRLAISYHDPRYHRGTIYRHAGALPMYTGADGAPAPGSSGKYGWCWRLPEPDWNWADLTDLRSRTLRLF